MNMETFVPPSAAVRAVVRTVGYEGFGVFKIALTRDLGGLANQLPPQVDPADDLVTIARKIIRSDIEALQQTTLRLGGADAAIAVTNAIVATKRRA